MAAQTLLVKTLSACHAGAFSVAGWTFSDKSHSLMRFAHFFTACALPSAAQITAVSAADPDNPLLKESALPYYYPPFDKIKDAHFVPAIEAAIREQLMASDLVASHPETPTLD